MTPRRTWPRHWAVMIVALVIAGLRSGGYLASATIELRLTPAEQKLLEEYRAQIAELKQRYANMYMEGVRREMSFPAYKSAANPQGERARLLAFYAREGRMFRADSAPLGPDGRVRPGPVGLLLVRPEGFLAARKDGPNTPWVVSDWGPREDGLATLSYMAFQWSPCNAYVAPVEAWIFGPLPFKPDSYCVDKVEEEVEQSGRLVHVHAEALWKDGRQRGYRFTFYRDKWWALKEVTLGMRGQLGPKDEVLRGTYEYEAAVGSPPLLKRVEYWREVGPERTKTMVERFDVLKLDLHAPAERDFDTAALGIHLGTPRSVWLARSVILLTGIALIALYIMLRRRERKAAPAGHEQVTPPGG